MEYRFLGNSGLKVSVFSLGTWVSKGTPEKEASVHECMKAAYDAGVNFFDSAEVYGQGDSELIVGRAIKKFGWDRKSLVISTKIYWGGKGPNDTGLSRKHIIEGTKASLERLGLEYVDLIFAHRPDDLTPMEEVVRAFNWVIEKGWAFYWGTSEWSAEQITDAHRIAEKLGLIGPLMEQPQYNMLHRERFEAEYEPLYRKHRMGTTIWSPLASGVLTGKYLEGVPEGSRFALDDPYIKGLRKRFESPEGKAKMEKVRKLKTVADELGCSLAQLAIAWTIKNPNVSTAILGASRPEQLKETLKSLEVVPKLTPSVMTKINDILANKPKLPIARF